MLPPVTARLLVALKSSERLSGDWRDLQYVALVEVEEAAVLLLLPLPLLLLLMVASWTLPREFEQLEARETFSGEQEALRLLAMAAGGPGGKQTLRYSG